MLQYGNINESFLFPRVKLPIVIAHTNPCGHPLLPRLKSLNGRYACHITHCDNDQKPVLVRQVPITESDNSMQSMACLYPKSGKSLGQETDFAHWRVVTANQNTTICLVGFLPQEICRKELSEIGNFE